MPQRKFEESVYFALALTREGGRQGGREGEREGGMEAKEDPSGKNGQCL